MLFRITSGMFAIGLFVIMILLWCSYGMPTTPESWAGAILFHMTVFMGIAVFTSFALDKDL
jgi:hypothetical protein